MSTDMGPGDFADVDPDDDVADARAVAETMADEQYDDGIDVDSLVDDDGAVRSSEIDDATDALLRPPGVDGGPDAAGGDLATVVAERDEYRQLAQRVQADFDNFRKRAASQSQIDIDRATGRLAEALLPVLDAAEAAFLRHPDEVGPLLSQMLGELRKQGLETLDLDGRPFDPEVAEAVAHEPGDGGEAVVVEVLRSGYTWKGRTLRPAMVKTRD